MKHLIDKKTGLSKFAYKDDEEIVMGADTITIPNNPPAKVVQHSGGRITRYLGGTVICDKEFVKNAILIEEKDGKFVDAAANTYTFDAEKTIFIKEAVK